MERIMTPVNAVACESEQLYANASSIITVELYIRVLKASHTYICTSEFTGCFWHINTCHDVTYISLTWHTAG